MQVRAHTSAGPGQFYNTTVAQFPTISLRLAFIAGGTSLAVGAILGAPFLVLTLVLCIRLCKAFRQWITKMKKRCV